MGMHTNIVFSHKDRNQKWQGVRESMSIFDGLESLGFENVSSLELFEKEKEKIVGPEQGPKEVNIADYLYLKSFKCPVCYKNFHSTQAQRRRLRLTSSEMDLRAVYVPLDPMYYDVLICSFCGYAAMQETFEKITPKQKDRVKENITSKFRPKEYPLILSTEQAIERYKLALLNALIKDVKNSEKGYLCLKIAWLYRDMKDEKNELIFIENAHKGFAEALSKESLPVFGMDDTTLMYIVGELSRRLGRHNEALKLMSDVIVTRGASERLKDRARDVRDLIKAEMEKPNPGA
jgi:uncharacterized protein (DUF2225 family)